MDRSEYAPSESGKKLTYVDYLGFPDDGLRHEIIDGVHFVSAAPATKHQRASICLSSALYQYLKANPIGEVFGAPFDVLLSQHDIVEPDVMVVLAEQQGIVTDQNVQGTPAIVVEILSPSTRRRDQDLKRRLYARTGVREYWLLDPDRDTVTIWSRSDEDRLTRAAELTRADGALLTSLLLPSFALSLDELFPHS